MTRDEYQRNLRAELDGKSKSELSKYAKEHGIKLFTVVPDKMRDKIIEVSAGRQFHGYAFWGE